MNKQRLVMSVIGVILLVSLACNISIGAPGTNALSKDDMIKTAIAQTYEANPPVAVNQATSTISVVQPQIIPPTNTPIPCNKAVFLSETIPDGSQIPFDSKFTKTWRFRNVGSCTWNTNYQLVFYSGDQMGGPAVKNFTQNVKPGEEVNISVDLKSPAFNGKYKGYWKLRSDQGEYYINNLWVSIEVQLVIKVAPIIIPLPDLQITNFLFYTSCAVSVPCNIKIEIHNAGTADAGPFAVSWYALSSDSNPTKVWNLAGLAAGANETINHPWTYGIVGYFSTIVKVDINNQVTELIESNNSATNSFTVSP